MMLAVQLARLVRPLNNQFKSIVTFGDLITSRNFLSRGVSKVSYIGLPNEPITKPDPELSLKFDPQTKKLSLQLGEIQLGKESNSSQTNSEFCSYCNAPRCKILTRSSETDDNNESAKNDQRTVTISIDKEAFCQAICSSLKSGSQSGAGDGSSYCQWCNAPKCKLTKEQLSSLKAIEGSSGSSSNPNDTGKEYCKYCRAPKCKITKDQSGTKRNKYTSDKSGEDSEYCKYCDAPKCELKTSKEDQSMTKRNKYTSDKSGNDSEYCKYCDAPKCELTTRKEDQSVTKRTKYTSDKSGKDSEYCEYCDAPKCDLTTSTEDQSATKRSRSVNMITGGKSNPSTDVTKSPDYCSECKLPVCKYLPPKTQTGKELVKTTGTSKSSDKISITVNAAEICGAICRGEETSKRAAIKPNSSRTSISRREKAPKVKNFITNYDIDNSKI